MKLSAPTKLVFLIALTLGSLGILIGTLGLVSIPALAGIVKWLLPAGFILLVLSVLLAGL
jgi:hypothetical protein